MFHTKNQQSKQKKLIYVKFQVNKTDVWHSKKLFLKHSPKKIKQKLISTHSKLQVTNLCGL